jgi:ketosteroid isomerase-like protein
MPVRAVRLAALSIVLALLGAVAAAAPDPAPVPLPSIQLPPELARVLTDYEKAWRARDAAALARLFAEDGFVMSSNQLPVRGRAAIEQRYTGSGGPLLLRAFAYATDGKTGYIVGGFTNRQGAADIGKYTLTLSRGADGRWLIFSDMDNGNRP